jgi:hypothetical protein
MLGAMKNVIDPNCFLIMLEINSIREAADENSSERIESDGKALWIFSDAIVGIPQTL